MRRPLDSCPRCGSSEISGERFRPLSEGGVLWEVYVSCPRCRYEDRMRTTTGDIERELRRFRACARRIEHERLRNGRPSSVAASALDDQGDRLRTVAVRAGLAEEVPELCRLS
jgi:hypothetical protein